jgi:GntR family transcriptional regulator of arabinose operon
MIALDKTTKFEQIRDRLREMLLTGQLQPGSRFYSESRLAGMLGVARMTVNKALGVLASEGLLERIQGKGTYVTARVAELRAERCAVQHLPLALLTSYWPGDRHNRTYVCMQCIEAIDDGAAELDFDVKVYNFQGQTRIAPEIYDDLLGNRYSGIIAYHLPDELNSQFKALLENTSTPVVVEGPISNRVDSVDYDHDWIGWRGADYLMELGHRKLAFLGYQTDLNWMNQRITGFSRACDTSNQTCQSSRIFKIGGGKYHPGAQQEMADVFDDVVAACTGLMCANDELAAMFMEVADERGVEIPGQVSIIGADDNGAYRALNLTTFRLSGGEIAQNCLDLLTQRIDQPTNPKIAARLLKPRLQERSTTGALSKHEADCCAP